LKFVRSRHGDSDFGRSARQFAVLAGIKDKLISLKSLNKLDSTIDLFFKMIRTDLSIGNIKSLIETFGNTSTYTKNEIRLTTENVLSEGKSSDGQYILIPKAGSFNFSEIKSFINSNI
jgi:anionic cell wall polymer biosynthesis LytR-Cps2A-Psr (LCP) family protein